MSNPTGKDAVEYARHHAEQAGYEMGHHLYDNPDTADRLATARDHLAKAVHWLDQNDAFLGDNAQPSGRGDVAIIARVRGCLLCGGEHDVGEWADEACPLVRVTFKPIVDSMAEVAFVLALERLLQGQREFDRGRADLILCNLLRQLGYDKVVDAYDPASKKIA